MTNEEFRKEVAEVKQLLLRAHSARRDGGPLVRALNTLSPVPAFRCDERARLVAYATLVDDLLVWIARMRQASTLVETPDGPKVLLPYSFMSGEEVT